MQKVLGTLLAVALVAGACGGDSGDGGPDPSEEPKEALIEAFEDLGEGDGVSMRFSLASDEESLQAALAEEGDVPEDLASTILDSSITFAGGAGDDPEEAKAEVIFELDGEEAAAIVVDGYDIYAHADIPYMMETFGEDPAALDDALSEVPPGFDFVDEAIDNQWIHLTGLEQLAQQAEASGQSAGVPNVSEQQKEIVDKLGQSLDQNATVSEGDEDGPGTHLEARLDMRAFAQDFQELSSQLAQIPGGGGLDQMPSSGEDIPEGDFILDAWVDDGRLTQVELDFIKNAETLGEGEDLPEGVEELGLLIELEEFDGDVDVPDDAVEVSFEQIFTALLGSAGMAGTGSEGAAPGGTEDICKEIEALPPEQQEPFKDICPGI